MTKELYTPTIASATQVIRGHALTKVTFTPTIASVKLVIRGARCD